RNRSRCTGPAATSRSRTSAITGILRAAGRSRGRCEERGTARRRAVSASPRYGTGWGDTLGRRVVDPAATCRYGDAFARQARTTLPALRQEVQTRIFRLVPPPAGVRTD